MHNKVLITYLIKQSIGTNFYYTGFFFFSVFDRILHWILKIMRRKYLFWIDQNYEYKENIYLERIKIWMHCEFHSFNSSEDPKLGRLYHLGPTARNCSVCELRCLLYQREAREIVMMQREPYVIIFLHNNNKWALMEHRPQYHITIGGTFVILKREMRRSVESGDWREEN